MKIKALLVAASACLALGATATPAFAWTELGVRNVADRTDHDSISLNGHRLYDHIKLCVYRNPIRLYDLHITFNNGGDQDVSVRNFLRAGSCTRAIDLTGGQRDIARIDMTYEETSWRRRTATVRVFGE